MTAGPIVVGCLFGNSLASAAAQPQRARLCFFPCLERVLARQDTAMLKAIATASTLRPLGFDGAMLRLERLCSADRRPRVSRC